MIMLFFLNMKVLIEEGEKQIPHWIYLPFYSNSKIFALTIEKIAEIYPISVLDRKKTDKQVLDQQLFIFPK